MLKTPKSTFTGLMVTMGGRATFHCRPANFANTVGNRVARLGEQLNQPSPLLTLGSDVGKTHSDCQEQPSASCREKSCLYLSRGKQRARSNQLWNGAAGPRALHRALGKVFLAGLSETKYGMLYENKKKLDRLTPNTVTSYAS